MIGKNSYPYDSCVLARVDRRTYITAIPPAAYDHVVKIVRLSNTNTNLLF